MALSVYLAFEYIAQMNGHGIVAPELSAPAYALLNFLNHLALWFFPWTLESLWTWLWIPMACVILIYFWIRNYSFVAKFLMIESLVLIGVMIWSPPASFTIRHPYLSAMISAILIAALFDWLWTRWGKLRSVQMILVSGVGVIVCANAMSVADAAATWNETVRQRRVPFHDIAQRYPNLPEDTFIYFIEPPYLRDLSGLFLARYDGRVSVGGTTDEAVIDNTLNPFFQRPSGAVPATSNEAALFASWRSHQNPIVYYFDATGKPVEVRVAKDATTKQTPALPADFSAPIRLEGFELTSNVLHRGDTLVVLLYWRASGVVDKDYTVFLHLVNEEGQVVFGEDVQPRGGTSRTSTWVPGKVVADAHLVPIAEDILPGIYRLEIGTYYLPTMERLWIVNENTSSTSDKIVIEPFRIE